LGIFRRELVFFWVKLFLQNCEESLEICVKVININVDKENPVLTRCEALKEYSEFMEQVRFNVENEIPEALTVAIKQSIKQGFLSEYLSRKSTEVENMLLTEYDYDTDIAVQRQEAYEDGMEQGITQGIQQGSQQAKIETAKNLLSMSISIENISKATNLSVEEIKALAK
jgi:predicted transposase/invertase (TIGR01784 family)